MKTLLCAIALGAALAPAAATPLFNLQYVPGTPGQARLGFQAAAARWAGALADNVSIDLTVGFNPLGASILGQTSSAESFFSYGAVRAALTADASSAADRSVVAHLPAGAGFGMLINRTANSPFGPGSATPYLDHNGDANNTTIHIANAEAKALGLTPQAQRLDGCTAACDGFIQFNSNFTFDFKPQDGIAAGAIDFVGVAAHEIGHALGFISGVDILDYNAPPNNGPFADTAFSYVSALDLLRYSAQSAAAGVIDWSADQRAKYFSLDGGTTAGPLFATGETFGDGRQASHWKDNLGIGIMDPTAAYGERLDIAGPDLLAMDAIGWDLRQPLPEAPSPALLGIGLAALAVARRRAAPQQRPVIA